MDESETGCINDKSPAVGLRVEYEEKCFFNRVSVSAAFRCLQYVVGG